MVPETKQDGSKTFTGTLNERKEEKERERGRARDKEEEGGRKRYGWTGSEIGKSHGTPSHSGSEPARL